jgi:hypothetical protein
MSLADFSLQNALIPFAVGAAFLVLTAVLLAWSSSARAAYIGPETVIFARSPGKVIGGAVAIALIAAVIGVVGVGTDNTAFIVLLLFGFFAVVWWGQFLVPTLVFYVADASGLTRQVLSFKKTLPWHAIDWVYPARKTTSYRTYGVKMGQSTEEALLVEAGPRQKLKVVLKAWLVRGDAQPLVQAINERATAATFGFDKQPLVRQRRAAGVAH